MPQTAEASRAATIDAPRSRAPALPLPRARLQPKKETDHAR
jgi:hypothetical protein